MIVDSSALVAILLREPGWHTMEAAILDADRALLPAAAYVETAIRVDARRDLGLSAALDTLVRSLGLEIAPLTADQAHLARAAFRRYGKGMDPAGLNFGDCLVYALAKTTGEPLLFKGGDFGRTDLTPALPA